MVKLKEGEIVPLINNRMFLQTFYYHEGIKLLERFVSYYLDISYEKIHKHLTLLPRDAELDKRITAEMQLDLVLDLDGFKINIELNNRNYVGLRERNLAYVELLGGHQYKKIKGKKSKDIYKEIKGVLAINLNGFGYTDKLITRYRLISEETRTLFSDNLRIDDVDMSKIKSDYKCTDKIEEKIYLWCELLNTNNIYILKEICDKLLPRREAERMVKVVDYICKDEERYLLGDEEDQQENIRAAMIEQARLDGIEDGSKEKTKESAIKLHKNGVSEEVIINSLDITKEQLEEYLKEDIL